MIDRESDDGAWEEARAPTHPSLRVLSQKELHDPWLIERIRQSHGLATLGEARDMIAAEAYRRTTTTNFGGNYGKA